MTRIWWILIRAPKSPKNLHFEKSFSVMFDLKKSSGVIFHGTREWCKIWRKTDFCFQKWHEEFEKFSPEHLKVSKLGLWWDSFVQSWKCTSLRYTGELCVMRMKNGAKIEEELTSQFKTDMNNLQILIQALKNLKKLHLMGCLWPNYMFDPKKYRGVMFDGTEYWCKIWRKTDFCFQKWHNEFGKFSPKHLKVPNFGLWNSFKSKVENVWA